MNTWLEEKLSYRGKGSYRFSEDQRKSYALILDIEVISFVKEPYSNLEWNTPRGFWGNCTIFHGTTIAQSSQMNFAKQRFITTKNRALIDYLRDKQNFENEERLVTNWEELLEFAFEQVVPFESLPLLRHEETVLKFVASPFTQFQFQCYWLRALDNPDDLPEFTESDPSKDDDEYPNPERRTPDSPFNPSKPRSPFNPDSDSRDFEPDEEEGGSIQGTIQYVYRRADNGTYDTLSISASWPGNLVGGLQPSVQSSVSWVDAEGTIKSMTVNNQFDAEVRNMIFTANDGRTFVPDPASLTDPR